MSRSDRLRAAKRLKLTEIPEEVIEELAKSLGTDTATAVDLIMLLQPEPPPRGRRERSGS